MRRKLRAMPEWRTPENRPCLFPRPLAYLPRVMMAVQIMEFSPLLGGHRPKENVCPKPLALPPSRFGRIQSGLHSRQTSQCTLQRLRAGFALGQGERRGLALGRKTFHPHHQKLRPPLLERDRTRLRAGSVIRAQAFLQHLCRPAIGAPEMLHNLSAVPTSLRSTAPIPFAQAPGRLFDLSAQTFQPRFHLSPSSFRAPSFAAALGFLPGSRTAQCFSRCNAFLDSPAFGPSFRIIRYASYWERASWGSPLFSSAWASLKVATASRGLNSSASRNRL